MAKWLQNIQLETKRCRIDTCHHLNNRARSNIIAKYLKEFRQRNREMLIAFRIKHRQIAANYAFYGWTQFFRHFSSFIYRIVCIHSNLIYDFIVTMANLFLQRQICHFSISDCNNSFSLFKNFLSESKSKQQKTQYNRILVNHVQHHMMNGNKKKRNSIRFFSFV